MFEIFRLIIVITPLDHQPLYIFLQFRSNKIECAEGKTKRRKSAHASSVFIERLTLIEQIERKEIFAGRGFLFGKRGKLIKYC
jgi:hypothetical protein